MKVQIDHIVIGTANLILGSKILENKLSTKFCSGGEHKIMGTHNKLLRLQSNIYLEIIAINPKVKKLSHSRWFSLDNNKTKEKIKYSPRPLCWILKVDDIEKAVKNCGYNPGEIKQISRGKLSWKITIPSDGNLLDKGVLPFFIEWSGTQHPSKKLINNKVSLDMLSLTHPEPLKIKGIISNLIESDLIFVSKGASKIEFGLKTLNNKVFIN